MIKALSPLGKTHHISILLAFDEDRCTATVIVKPKKDEKAAKSFQFEGTVDEVDAAVAAQTEAAARKILSTASTIAELESQLKADEDEVKKKVTEKKGAKKDKEKSAPTPAAKPAGKTGAKAATTSEKPTTAKPATALLDDL